MVGDGQALEALAHRRLAQHEADARRLDGPAVRVRVVAQPGEPGRPGQAEERRRSALTEAPQVLAEPCLDGSLRAGAEPLDEPANAPEGLLEGEPRVALADLRPGLRPDVTGRHPERGVPARPGPEPARRKDGAEERDAQGSHDGRRAQIALDPLEDRTETDQLAPGVEVEQLARQSVCARDGRETGKERGAHRIGADIRADPLQVVGVERRLAQLPSPALVAADRAAVMLGDRSHPPGDPGLVVDDPQDLVDDERAAACRAARREHLADRCLEAGFAAR